MEVFVWIGFNAVPGLSTLDYITVAVIEKYLDFKVRKTLIMLDTLLYPSKKGRLEYRLWIGVSVRWEEDDHLPVPVSLLATPHLPIILETFWSEYKYDFQISNQSHSQKTQTRFEKSYSYSNSYS